jgi:carboxyl-terminal processing protease
MRRRLIYGLVITLLAVNFIVGAWIYLGSARAAERNDAIDPNLDLFSEVLERVRSEYVDGQNLTYRELTYAAVKGMVNVLDPHSEFLIPPPITICRMTRRVSLADSASSSRCGAIM